MMRDRRHDNTWTGRMEVITRRRISVHSAGFCWFWIITQYNVSPIGTGDLFLFVPWFRAQILDNSSTTWTCVYIFSLFEFYIIRVNLFKKNKERWSLHFAGCLSGLRFVWCIIYFVNCRRPPLEPVSFAIRILVCCWLRKCTRSFEFAFGTCP